MKKTIIALAIALCVAPAVYAQTPQAPVPQAQEQVKPAVDKNAPKFSFMGGDTHDFGNLTDQKDGEYNFKFKNTGKTPLIIGNASASCGCTVPEFPKQPILPGKTGEIKVTFHTAGKSGPFQKTIWIQSNAPSNVTGDRYEIYIKGSVTPGGQQTSGTVTPQKG
jgi:hypothetical protein